MGVQEDARISALKKAFERVTHKREMRVITDLVNKHRAGTLTPNDTFCAIIAISELRLAKSEIDGKDLHY